MVTDSEVNLITSRFTEIKLNVFIALLEGIWPPRQDLLLSPDVVLTILLNNLSLQHSLIAHLLNNA